MQIHRVLAAAIVPALFLILTGCAALTGNGPLPARATPAAGSTPAPPPATRSPAARSPGRLPDGRQAAIVTYADPARSRITVDIVQWFGGAAAIAAARQDGREVTDDYYVRNSSHRLRVLPVARTAVITTNTLSSEETGDPTRTVRATLADLARSGHLDETLFWVTTRNGVVTRLSEQYTP